MRINELRQSRIDAERAHGALLDTHLEAAKAAGRGFTAEEKAEQAAAEKKIADVSELVAAEEKRIAAEKARPSHSIEVGRDNRIDRPWSRGAMGLGEWAMSCLRAVSGQGTDPRLYKAAATGMGENGAGADGAFAVPGEQTTEVEAKMFETGQILSQVDARDILGDHMTYNIIRNELSRANGSRYGGVQGYWVDEGEAPSASTIKLTRMELKLRKVGALGYMTDELLQDAAALGGELQNALADELVFQVEDKIWEGTGAGTPLGFTNSPCWVAITIESGQTLANGPVLVQNLSKMWARMPPRQKAQSNWYVSSEMMVALDALALPVGTAALEPRFVSYGPDGIMRIKGRPVIEVEYASALGTIGDIALCNFRQYRLIKKAGGVQQDSSIHVRFAQGETTFRAFYRCDGQPVPRGTVAEFKGSNARTPFVGLGTRA
jgi:HK97 family phage major capsid protein